MRQVYTNGKWREGLPIEQGQRFRFITAGGWQYGTYAPEPAPEVVDMRITKLAFKHRFTQQERIDIREASKTIPKVYDFEDLVNSATFIDLSRDDTKIAVNAVESVIPLTQGRANEILTAQIQEHERYRG